MNSEEKCSDFQNTPAPARPANKENLRRSPRKSPAQKRPAEFETPKHRKRVRLALADVTRQEAAEKRRLAREEHDKHKQAGRIKRRAQREKQREDAVRRKQHQAKRDRLKLQRAAKQRKVERERLFKKKKEEVRHQVLLSSAKKRKAPVLETPRPAKMRKDTKPGSILKRTPISSRYASPHIVKGTPKPTSSEKLVLSIPTPLRSKRKTGTRRLFHQPAFLTHNEKTKRDLTPKLKKSLGKEVKNTKHQYANLTARSSIASPGSSKVVKALNFWTPTPQKKRISRVNLAGSKDTTKLSNNKDIKTENKRNSSTLRRLKLSQKKPSKQNNISKKQTRVTKKPNQSRASSSSSSSNSSSSSPPTSSSSSSLLSPPSSLSSSPSLSLLGPSSLTTSPISSLPSSKAPSTLHSPHVKSASRTDQASDSRASCIPALEADTDHQPKVNPPRQPKISSLFKPKVNHPHQPRVSSPRPKVSSPRPKVSSPRPKVSSPHIKVPSPRPKVPSPRLKVPSPRPKVSSPHPNVSPRSQPTPPKTSSWNQKRKSKTTTASSNSDFSTSSPKFSTPIRSRNTGFGKSVPLSSAKAKCHKLSKAGLAKKSAPSPSKKSRVRVSKLAKPPRTPYTPKTPVRRSGRKRRTSAKFTFSSPGNFVKVRPKEIMSKGACLELGAFLTKNESSIARVALNCLSNMNEGVTNKTLTKAFTHLARAQIKLNISHGQRAPNVKKKVRFATHNLSTVEAPRTSIKGSDKPTRRFANHVFKAFTEFKHLRSQDGVDEFCDELIERLGRYVTANEEQKKTARNIIEQFQLFRNKKLNLPYLDVGIRVLSSLVRFHLRFVFEANVLGETNRVFKMLKIPEWYNKMGTVDKNEDTGNVEFMPFYAAEVFNKLLEYHVIKTSKEPAVPDLDDEKSMADIEIFFSDFFEVASPHPLYIGIAGTRKSTTFGRMMHENWCQIKKLCGMIAQYGIEQLYFLLPLKNLKEFSQKFVQVTKEVEIGGGVKGVEIRGEGIKEVEIHGKFKELKIDGEAKDCEMKSDEEKGEDCNSQAKGEKFNSLRGSELL